MSWRSGTRLHLNKNQQNALSKNTALCGRLPLLSRWSNWSLLSSRSPAFEYASAAKDSGIPSWSMGAKRCSDVDRMLGRSWLELLCFCYFFFFYRQKEVRFARFSFVQPAPVSVMGTENVNEAYSAVECVLNYMPLPPWTCYLWELFVIYTVD